MSTENPPAGFDAWFQETLGTGFPVRLDTPLVPLRDRIWKTPSAGDGPVPMTTRCPRPAGDFWLAGFWGHSVNSYAFYLVGRSGPHQCFFRLAFGGAYGDPGKDAGRVIGFLRGYQRFREKRMPRLQESELLHEMGQSRAALTLKDGRRVCLDDPPGADPAGFWQRLEEAMAE